MGSKLTYSLLIIGLLCFSGMAQDLAYNDAQENPYEKAYKLANLGNHNSAKKILLEELSGDPGNMEARILLARTYSWTGQYDKARGEFNKITSIDHKSRNVWISAIKNELYAREDATALGLSYKALGTFKNDPEIERLSEIALKRINNKQYDKLGWYNQEADLVTNLVSQSKSMDKGIPKEIVDSIARSAVKIIPKTPVDKDLLNNRIVVNNSFTIFDQRYDPMIYSSVSFRRQTWAGSIIPRINYSNRLGKHGVQYDLDFYPKFSKRLYAYINYGYSNASIYPNHKLGGDLYVNLPGAIEFSAGGRYIKTNAQNISVVTNSLGYYRGNYYFSLRSYITPRPDKLTRISGNFLIRKYLKDAESYLGVNIGMGISPELRQLTSGDELLAETFLYIESQRVSLQYQFSAKKTMNIYRANLGVARQELIYNSGSYFWGVSAGITYQVKF